MDEDGHFNIGIAIPGSGKIGIISRRSHRLEGAARRWKSHGSMNPSPHQYAKHGHLDSLSFRRQTYIGLELIKECNIPESQLGEVILHAMDNNSAWPHSHSL